MSERGFCTNVYLRRVLRLPCSRSNAWRVSVCVERTGGQSNPSVTRLVILGRALERFGSQSVGLAVASSRPEVSRLMGLISARVDGETLVVNARKEALSSKANVLRHQNTREASSRYRLQTR